MRILVSGREGQVARSLVERGSNFEWVFAARPDFDLAVPGSFAAAIKSKRPNLVINTAAYTAVDRAEEEEALAYRVNAEAAGEGAEAAAQIGVPFIQISTDYVFDGSGGRPWRENDRIAPLNAYGRTKAAGEAAVLAACSDHTVIRTSWLIGPYGRNFLKTILSLANQREELRVVSDQWGTPTNTLHLADGILKLVTFSRKNSIRGIWHLAGTAMATWSDIASEILACSKALGGARARVQGIRSDEYPVPAQRPKNSMLDCSLIRRKFGLELPPWDKGLTDLILRTTSGS